jgi:hypothetical protein
MPQPKSEPHAEKLAMYAKAVAAIEGIEIKGATVPYTSINGHMFSYLSKEGTLSLRLPEGAREAFLEKYKTRLCTQYGIVQKEYVEVPDALLRKPAELAKHFACSLEYVGAMKPKPTTRKK